ncbi:hypothetical protein [Shewanella putrefaciens]|uniref:hypothetical protein n=1 Tax=Shewanella putrefaciens TaxID=24 RepID=UPI003D795AB1
MRYQEGDIFIIPTEGKFAICQIVFAPKGKFKQVIGFCVLFLQDNKVFKSDDVLRPLPIMDMGKEMKVCSGQLNLATALESSQNLRSDSFGLNPAL